MTTSIYQGFLIVEDPTGCFTAYRNMDYYRGGITSYMYGDQPGIESMIDNANDYGGFTEEVYGREFGQMPRGSTASHIPIRGPFLSTEVLAMGSREEMYYILAYDKENTLVGWDGHMLPEGVELIRARMVEKFPYSLTFRVIKIQRLEGP